MNCVNGHRKDHTKETRWLIDTKLIDKSLADYKTPEDIIGEHGLLKQLTKAVLERAMPAEMTGEDVTKNGPLGRESCPKK